MYNPLHMLMLDFQKIKESYTVYEKRKYKKRKKQYSYFEIKGVKVWGIQPPKEFPNHLLTFRFEKNKNSNLSFSEEDNLDREIHKELQQYEIPSELNFNEPAYLGAYSKTNDYELLFYRPDLKSNEPVVIEKNRWDNEKYKDKRFYKVENHYVCNDEFFEGLEKVKGHANKTYKPIWYNDYNLQMTKIPLYLLDGKEFLYLFSDQLSFEITYSGTPYVLGNLKTGMTKGGLYGKTKDTFKTAEELFYVYEEKYPNMRQFLIVNDRDLRGNVLEHFEIGDKVIVRSPNDKHKELRGQIGLVDSKERECIEVKFLNYFTEIFHPNEITKVNSTNC